jgi:hypothetical protein
VPRALRYPPMPRSWLYMLSAAFFFTLIGMVIAITKLA